MHDEQKHKTYTGWSKGLWAPDDCIVIIRCTEKILSPYRRRNINYADQDRDLRIVTFSETQAVIGLFVLSSFVVVLLLLLLKIP